MRARLVLVVLLLGAPLAAAAQRTYYFGPDGADASTSAQPTGVGGLFASPGTQFVAEKDRDPVATPFTARLPGVAPSIFPVEGAFHVHLANRTATEGGVVETTIGVFALGPDGRAATKDGIHRAFLALETFAADRPLGDATPGDGWSDFTLGARAEGPFVAVQDGIAVPSGLTLVVEVSSHNPGGFAGLGPVGDSVRATYVATGDTLFSPLVEDAVWGPLRSYTDPLVVPEGVDHVRCLGSTGQPDGTCGPLVVTRQDPELLVHSLFVPGPNLGGATHEVTNEVVPVSVFQLGGAQDPSRVDVTTVG